MLIKDPFPMKNKIITIALIAFFLVSFSMLKTQVRATPGHIQEQESEWNQFLRGWSGVNDTRFTFGLTYQDLSHWVSFMSNDLGKDPDSEADWEWMIQNYLLPHNIYWITIYNYNKANTSTTDILYQPRVDKFLSACDKYSIRAVFYTPTWSFDKGTSSYGYPVIQDFGNEYAEVHKNGSTINTHIKFDHLTIWESQITEDVKQLDDYYGDHPSFYGFIFYWEFRSLYANAYHQLGYSNQSLGNFTDSSYYLNSVNSTGFHENGAKCKLWEMFVDQTANYNTTTLADDTDNYHNTGFIHYKYEMTVRIANFYAELFRTYINSEGLLFHDGSWGSNQFAQAQLHADGVVWAERVSDWGDIGARPTPNQAKLTTHYTMYQQGTPSISNHIPGYMPGNNGGAATSQDVQWHLTMSIVPVGEPVTWIMVTLSKLTDGYFDMVFPLMQTFSRMKYTRQRGFTDPIANILLVHGRSGDWSHTDPGMAWVWFLTSLGLNVTVSKAEDVKDFSNLSQFDTIVWFTSEHPADTSYVATKKVIDAINNTGTGLYLLGDAYSYNPKAAGYCTATGSLYSPFDGKLGDLVPLDVYWENRTIWNHVDANDWTFTNLTHPIWKPYSSFSLNDFLWTRTNGRHRVWDKNSPTYENYGTLDLIYDNKDRSVACAVPENTTTGRGRILWFGMYDTVGGMPILGELYSKATTVILNGILWTAKKDDYIPLLSFPPNQGKTTELFYSFHYYEAGKALLWFSNNKSTAQTLNWNLNSKIFNLADQWIAIKLRTWEVVKAGSGTNVSLTFTIPAKTWEPILLVNTTNNLYELYSNLFINSRAISANKATYTLQGPCNQTGWLIVNSTKQPASVSSNITDVLPQYPLDTLNSGSTLQGWHFNSTNKILCIKFCPTSAVQITVEVNKPPTNQTLTLVNPSIGTQGVLASKQPYTIQVNVSDPNGVTNLNYVDLTLDPARQALRVRWNESTNSFNEVNDPNDYIELGSSSKSTLGNQVTLDFAIVFHWNYPDENTHPIRVYSIDDGDLSDTDDFTGTYYVENNVIVYSATVDDDHVNPNQTITFSGHIYYEGTTIPPPSGHIITIELGTLEKGTTTTDENGYYSKDESAEIGIAKHTYAITSTHSISNNTVDVIVDKLTVSISADEYEVVEGTMVDFNITITRKYDSTSVTSFSITIRRNGTSWLTLTDKEFDDNLLTVGHYVYTTGSVTDNTYGLSIFETNNVTVSWRQKTIIPALQFIYILVPILLATSVIVIGYFVHTRKNTPQPQKQIPS